MSRIVAALIEGKDGYEMYTRLRNIQHVSQLQGVSARNAEVNITDPNCVNCRPSQAFDRVPFDGPERFKIGRFRRYVAGSTCVEDERKV